MNKKLLGFASAAAVGLASLAPVNANATNVALELALLVDVSGSVDTPEFVLQRDGYKAAFNSATIQSAIASLTGGIAVTYIQWSSAAEQFVSVGWTHVYDAATAAAFGNAIGAAPRIYAGSTAPGSALNFATPKFGTETGGTDNGFTSLRQVIDVSGDGSKNDGADTPTARDAALRAGIDAINGLAILGSEAGLLEWYENNIQGGTGSFVESATFANFAEAVERKIGKEIKPTPEPGTLALLGLGLLGLGASRRRKTA